MKLLFKHTLFLILWVCCLAPHAQASNIGENDSKVSKTITEGYLMPKNGYLEITNKYGQILINNSDNDSVTVKVEVIAYGKDRETANKIMNRVDFDFDHTNEYLTLETVLDRKSGAFKELWNNIGDYSKTLLSKNKLEINFEVSVPSSTSISIVNKFGDVFISDRNKKVEIDMSHGDLRANNLSANSSIALSYGNAQIKDYKEGALTFKASEATIKSAGRIEINSSSSEITIANGKEITLNSKSDKYVEITTTEKLKGKMTLSKLKVEELSKSLDIDLRYTDISIGFIPFNFSLIRIEGKYSDIDLDFEPSTYMDVDITVDENEFTLPLESLDKHYIDEKKGIARYRGLIGKKNNYKGNLNIDSENGEVSVKLKPINHTVKTN